MKIIGSYSRHVKFLAKRKSKALIQNGQKDHAAVIYENIFDQAKEEVVIFCNRLDAEVFGRPEIIKAFDRAIARKVRFQILTENEPDKSSFLKAVHRAQSDGIPLELKRLAPEENTSKANFCVFDNIGFRYERNNSETRAVASFNRPDDAQELKRRYLSYYNKAA